MSEYTSPTPVEGFLDPDDPILFPRLTAAQIEQLAESAETLSLSPGEVRGKNAGKNIYVTMTANVEVVPGMEARGIEPGKGRSKYFVRVQQQQELGRKTGQMHDVGRVVDRRNDRYYEHIVDVEIGEVVRHKDEPLSEHVAECDLRRREQQEHD